VVIAAEAALEYGFKDFMEAAPSLREQKGSPRPFSRKLIFRLREPPFLTASRNCHLREKLDDWDDRRRLAADPHRSSHAVAGDKRTNRK